MLAMKQIRERLGFTQSAVARELGVSRQAYNQWELGKRQADYEYLLRLAELFDTTVENILTGCLENAKPLTETQERLAALAEAGDPSPQVRMLMGLKQGNVKITAHGGTGKSTPLSDVLFPGDTDDTINDTDETKKPRPAIIQNASDLVKRFDTLSEEDVKQLAAFVDIMGSDSEADKTELKTFMEFIMYRKNKNRPDGRQREGENDKT